MSIDVSALIVPVPTADPIVGAYRTALDSGAAVGVPAHITVLYPFAPVDAIDDGLIAELEQLFASVDPFSISLDAIGWFDEDVVFVRPEPDGPLRRLTARVVERWPQWPPYGGAHGDPTPHLTIGDNGDLRAMRRAAAAIAAALPIDVDVTAVHLWCGSDRPASWHPRLSFPLRPAAS